MKLNFKLMLAPALTSLAMLASTVAGVWLFSDLQARSERELTAAALGREGLDQQRLNLLSVGASVYRTIAIIGSLDAVAQERARKGATGQVAEIVGTLTTMIQQAEIDTVRAPLQRAREQALKFGKAADTAIDMSSVDANTGVAMLQAAEAFLRVASNSLAEAASLTNDHAAKRRAEARDHARRMQAVGLAIAALTCLGALALAWRLQRQSVRALREASDAAARVSAGDLHPTRFAPREDEIGELQQAQTRVVEQLHAVVSHVRASAHTLQTAAAEVASGSFDLSNRTVQTAASLQQINGTMDELAQTMQSTADSTAEAKTLVASANEVAVRGGEVVGQVVATMNDINSSSQRIADIIGVIDGIAFQTNLLALNAAVEAARAGEQGRGFAVVAAEVRGLAHRSAGAAREIKGLISDSVSKAQAGATQVTEAGHTMHDIVASVERVQAIIARISAATSEQNAAIAQINSSMAEVESATQQNGSLVAEYTAAAESLKLQSGQLAQAVSHFELARADAQASALQHAPFAESPPAESPPAAHAPPSQAVAQATVQRARSSSDSSDSPPHSQTPARSAGPSAAQSSQAPVLQTEGDWEEF